MPDPPPGPYTATYLFFRSAPRPSNSPGAPLLTEQDNDQFPPHRGFGRVLFRGQAPKKSLRLNISDDRGGYAAGPGGKPKNS